MYFSHVLQLFLLGMDFDIVRKRNRFGRLVTTLDVLPDADLSENEVEDNDESIGAEAEQE